MVEVRAGTGVIRVFCRRLNVCTNIAKTRLENFCGYEREGTSGGFKEVILKLLVKMWRNAKV
jgi:hypothetical protein